MRWRKLLAVLAMGLASLAFVSGAAEAKSWPVATLCGQTRCTVLHHPTSDAFFDWWSTPFQLLSAPRPTPYYSVRWQDVDPTGSYTTSLLYVPSRQLMRIYESGIPYSDPRSPVGPYWRSVPRAQRLRLRRIVSQLRPHRAPFGWPKPTSA